MHTAGGTVAYTDTYMYMQRQMERQYMHTARVTVVYRDIYVCSVHVYTYIFDRDRQYMVSVTYMTYSIHHGNL